MNELKAPSAGTKHPNDLLGIQSFQAITRAELETIAVNALVRDTKFAPTDPDRVTTARVIVRKVFDALAKAGALP